MDADGAPEFDEIASHDALVDWSRAYARTARRGVGARRPTGPGRVGGVDAGPPTRRRGQTPAPRQCRRRRALRLGRRRGVGRPPAPRTVSLTWDAFDEFSRDEWQSTLRHELVHVEQYQRFGTTGHGTRFKRRAEEMDTAVHCRTFAEPKWTFYCESCDEVTAHRYRECKLVRQYERYRSNCCEAPLRRTSPAD